MPTAIEWTEETWNPVTGCSRVSPGCARCYIVRTPAFRMSGRRFERVGNEETTGITLHPERLEQPLRWRRPRLVFVNSLSDLFHEQIPYEFMREVFNVIRRCDGGTVAATGKRNSSHTFQVLTKRPERALELWRARKLGFTTWPANVWLGVSIENARYSWRADLLREIPAAVRFISAEPLLGSLLTTRGPRGEAHGSRGSETGGLAHEVTAPRPAPLDPLGRASDDTALSGGARGPTVAVLSSPRSRAWSAPRGDGDRGRGRLERLLAGIDWLIVGGESGPGARRMELEWARELVGECAHAGVACFVKQLGSVYAREYGPRGDPKAHDPERWPVDLRVRELPEKRALAA